jgi:hypothetical protein
MLVENPSDILRKIKTTTLDWTCANSLQKPRSIPCNVTYLPAHNCDLKLTKQLKHMQAFLETLINLNVNTRMSLLHVVLYLPRIATDFRGLSCRNFQRRKWLESAECERVGVTCIALYSGLHNDPTGKRGIRPILRAAPCRDEGRW